MKLPKLPGLSGLANLKQKAGSRLRAALVPELRDLADDLETLSIALEGTQSLVKEQRDKLTETVGVMGSLFARLDRWKATADSLENSENRLEVLETELADHATRIDDAEGRLDDLEGYDLDTISATVEELEELPSEWIDLSRRVQRLEDLRGALAGLLND